MCWTYAINAEKHSVFIISKRDGLHWLSVSIPGLVSRAYENLSQADKKLSALFSGKKVLLYLFYFVPIR